ncbi:hypothetical protein Pelo_9030 [Pelomyxa schiedti]|nr:hypothetical protein Pelo_9030 [Pelomyxa schiedti]
MGTTTSCRRYAVPFWALMAGSNSNRGNARTLNQKHFNPKLIPNPTPIFDMYCQATGAALNFRKTEVLAASPPIAKDKISTAWPVQTVTKYKYLGVYIGHTTAKVIGLQRKVLAANIYIQKQGGLSTPLLDMMWWNVATAISAYRNPNRHNPTNKDGTSPIWEIALIKHIPAHMHTHRHLQDLNTPGIPPSIRNQALQVATNMKPLNNHMAHLCDVAPTCRNGCDSLETMK